MTIAVTIAIVVIAGLIGYLVHAVISGVRSERASFAAEVLAGKAQVVAERAQWEAEKQRDQAEAERDTALADKAKAEAERDAARAELVKVQTALNKALEEHAHDTVEAIRSAPTSVAALGELERLLQATARGDYTLPPDGDAVAAAGGDHGPT